jgi:hypothetical protein
MSLCDLPPDVIDIITDQLPVNAIVRLQMTCKYLRNCVEKYYKCVGKYRKIPQRHEDWFLGSIVKVVNSYDVREEPRIRLIKCDTVLSLFNKLCRYGHLEPAQQLYSLCKIDINTGGNNAFRDAFINGHLAVVKWLYNSVYSQLNDMAVSIYKKYRSFDVVRKEYNPWFMVDWFGICNKKNCRLVRSIMMMYYELFNSICDCKPIKNEQIEGIKWLAERVAKTEYNFILFPTILRVVCLRVNVKLLKILLPYMSHEHIHMSNDEAYLCALHTGNEEIIQILQKFDNNYRWPK